MYQFSIITNLREGDIITSLEQKKYQDGTMCSSTDPLFPFGYGLSYTQFEYSDLRIVQKDLEAADTIRLSVKIKNTGSVTGKEVVQFI